MKMQTNLRLGISRVFGHYLNLYDFFTNCFDSIKERFKLKTNYVVVKYWKNNNYKKPSNLLTKLFFYAAKYFEVLE